LDANPIFEVLARDIVSRQCVAIGTPVVLAQTDGAASGLSVELFSVPGKVPLYLEDSTGTPVIVEGEETVGVAEMRLARTRPVANHPTTV
jgi:pyrroloquinoline quinone biosynthesis protein B